MTQNKGAKPPNERERLGLTYEEYRRWKRHEQRLIKQLLRGRPWRPSTSQDGG